MQKPIRVGVIGCGRVTTDRHLPALSRLDRVEVVALADRDAARLNSVADRYRVSQRYSDVGALLDQAEIDVIAVCVPAEFHAEVALAALGAKKHVFIEKPLAVTLDEADRIRERAAQANRKVMMGFNFRWHRLIRQARELLRQDAVGEVEMVRSVFASLHEAPSEWQKRRRTGGGALFDQAIHLFDLWRFLLESEVEEVSAASRSGARDDETAMVTARLKNGVLASAACSESTGENTELEIYGRRGRLQVSCYRFDGLAYFPGNTIPGSGRSRVQGLQETFRALPGGMAQLRYGGDVLASYRDEWRHFIDAIRKDTAVNCTLEDGARALEIALAAMASASKGQPIRINGEQREVTPVSSASDQTGPCESREPAIEKTAPGEGEPALSVVIVADRYETIRQTVRHLQAQAGHEQLELVIVTQSAKTFEVDGGVRGAFFRVQVVEVPEIFPLSLATSAGVRRATGPLVVLAESHAFPGPGWAQALIETHRQPYAAVGAVMGNANPGIISWASLFVDYGRCVETTAAAAARGKYLPGHHTCYKRDVLLGYDSQLEAVMDSEILLHWDIQAKGQQLRLEPEARVYHVNISSPKAWLAERFYSGRRFAATRSRDWPLLKRLLYFAGSPLIPLVRVPRVMQDLRGSTFPRRRWPAVVPPIVLGLMGSAAGEMAGYLLGPGDAMVQAAKMEIFKLSYLTDEDSRKLEAWSLDVTRRPESQRGMRAGEA